MKTENMLLCYVPSFVDRIVSVATFCYLVASGCDAGGGGYNCGYKHMWLMIVVQETQNRSFHRWKRILFLGDTQAQTVYQADTRNDINKLSNGNGDNNKWSSVCRMNITTTKKWRDLGHILITFHCLFYLFLYCVHSSLLMPFFHIVTTKASFDPNNNTVVHA